MLENGLAIGASQKYPGSVSDFDIFQRKKGLLLQQLKKKSSDRNMKDHWMFREEHRRMWKMIVKKGYQGILEILRGIKPVRRCPNQHLSIADLAISWKLSSEGAVVENYFGRLCGLWTLLSSTWRWYEVAYADLFKWGPELTNYHVQWKDLRADGNERFKNARNLLLPIVNDQIEKRRHAVNR